MAAVLVSFLLLRLFDGADRLSRNLASRLILSLVGNGQKALTSIASNRYYGILVRFQETFSLFVSFVSVSRLGHRCEAYPHVRCGRFSHPTKASYSYADSSEAAGKTHLLLKLPRGRLMMSTDVCDANAAENNSCTSR
jgi:hypothetical protein